MVEMMRTTFAKWQDRLPLWLVQTFWAGVFGAALAAVVVLAAVVGYGLAYRGRIFPGVQVAGVDVGGLTPAEATARLDIVLTYPAEGQVLLTYGQKTWQANPINLGFALDNRAAAQEAYRVGRRGGLWERLAERWRARQQGVDVPPVGVFSEPVALRYLNDIAASIDRPPVEAVLRLEGTKVVAKKGVAGARLDRAATLARLQEAFPRMQNLTLPLVVRPLPPEIADPTPQAELLRQILAAPLTITLPRAAKSDPGPWKFSPKTIAPMLKIERVQDADGAHFAIDLDARPLLGFLERLAPELQRDAANARYIFNDDTRQLELIQHAVEGRTLKVEASLSALRKAILSGKHTVALVVAFQPPAVGDDATAKELGITELVGKHTTYFYGSSAARIHNIQLAASHFHGYLVAPGEVFSMAKVLGDISKEAGYEEGLIIFGDRTVKGVGGGVCQVSTTLFRTVFFAGYPIVERHPHAYRVLYYEQTPSGADDPKLAGLDATVYAPVIDFKFKNDTPYWILMEVYVYPQYRYMTWKLYSTSDGRKVEWHTTGLQNIVDPPPPKYIENPDLKKGEIKQTDWAAQGADVTVTRIVWRNGKILYKDKFFTHYEPWQAVCEYGPGTPGMPPKHPDPKHPCKPDKPKNDGG